MLKIFQGKQPTAQEVTAQIEQARQQRAALEQRNTAIDQELAAAYGVEDAALVTLETEHSANRDKLRRLELSIVALHQERKAAQLREFAAEYRTQRAALADDVKVLDALKPRVDKARAEWQKLANQEQRLRGSVNIAQQNAAYFYDSHEPAMKAAGISASEWAKVKQAVDDDLPTADKLFASTRAQAEAITALYGKVNL